MEYNISNRNKIFLYLSLFLGLMDFIGCSKMNVNREWQNINTVEDLWNVHPGQIRLVFESMDLQRQELKH